ncbi:hypothetical protein ABZS88_40495 [Streptomyces sp. NPDC005480]|uniref:hypothetical protein n=1 Tax=Streptomyces sp. NPDC005480 TaxID=3154880 RepID=UPI0033B54A23
MGDRKGARQAITKTKNLAERLDSRHLADTWFGYPEQKHHVHLSQAYTLLGVTASARAEQERPWNSLTRPPS